MRNDKLIDEVLKDISPDNGGIDDPESPDTVTNADLKAMENRLTAAMQKKIDSVIDKAMKDRIKLKEVEEHDRESEGENGRNGSRTGSGASGSESGEETD